VKATLSSKLVFIPNHDLTFVLHQGRNNPIVKTASIGPPKEPEAMFPSWTIVVSRCSMHSA